MKTSTVACSKCAPRSATFSPTPTSGPSAGRKAPSPHHVPADQGNLLTCANASQVADHALKSTTTPTVFTKLDQADFMNREVTRRFKAYADLVATSDVTCGARWISQADVDGEKMIGPNVPPSCPCVEYDILNMQEYLNTFNDVSAAPERLMRRIIQTVATNALKTVYPVDLLGESAGPAPF